jgi:hypothetical protein
MTIMHLNPTLRSFAQANHFTPHLQLQAPLTAAAGASAVAHRNPRRSSRESTKNALDDAPLDEQELVTGIDDLAGSVARPER